MFGIKKYKDEFGLPDMLELEPTETCNLRCRMCHVSYSKIKKPSLLNIELLDKLTCMRGKFIRIASSYEPMIHPGFMKIIKWSIKNECEIEMITNATRLDEENRNLLADAKLHTLQISFDGIKQNTFEHIRRRANYEKIMDKILATRQVFKNRKTFFAINSTMMRSNMEEIEDVVKFWDSHDFDQIRFITMVIRDRDNELLKESLYPVRYEYYELLDEAAKNVIESNRKITLRSPYYQITSLRTSYPDNFVEDTVISSREDSAFVPLQHQKYQLGKYAGMPVPCKSPFTSARILANGDVQLCYKFIIGNLNLQSFEDIWFGEEAKKIRKMLRKDDKHCHHCDYYRFCLKSRNIDIEDKSNYFQGDLMEYAEEAYVK